MVWASRHPQKTYRKDRFSCPGSANVFRKTRFRNRWTRFSSAASWRTFCRPQPRSSRRVPRCQIGHSGWVGGDRFTIVSTYGLNFTYLRDLITTYTYIIRVIIHSLSTMDIPVLCRERRHFPPNGKRKIIDSKVPAGRGDMWSFPGG